MARERKPASVTVAIHNKPGRNIIENRDTAGGKIADKLHELARIMNQRSGVRVGIGQGNEEL